MASAMDKLKEEAVVEAIRFTAEEKKLIKTLGLNASSFRPYVRTPEQIDADTRFLKGYADSQVLPAMPPCKTWLYHAGGPFSYILAKTIKTIELAEGVYEIYSREQAEALAEGEALTPIVPQEGVRLLKLGTTIRPMYYGSSQDAKALFALPNGTLVYLTGIANLPAPSQTAHHAFRLTSNGKMQPEGVMTTAEFKALYPLSASARSAGYQFGICSMETADWWDKAPAVLHDFQQRVKLVPQVEILSVVPVWLRTGGWDLDGPQQATTQGVERRLLTPYFRNVLLRDVLCWRVHFQMRELRKNVPIEPGGVVHFTSPEEGANLVISDWCFRETPDGIAEKEMYHGKDNKHDIISWMAGPATDRFLGANAHNSSRGGEYGFENAFDQTNSPEKVLRAALWDTVLTSLDKNLVAKDVQELQSFSDKFKDRFGVMVGTTMYWLEKDQQFASAPGYKNDWAALTLVGYMNKGERIKKVFPNIACQLPLSVVPPSVARAAMEVE